MALMVLLVSFIMNIITTTQLSGCGYYSSIINCTVCVCVCVCVCVGGWLQLHYVPAVSASNMENIFSHQILFQAIQSYLFSVHTVILRVLGQGQSERNLKIGLDIFCQAAR